MTNPHETPGPAAGAGRGPDPDAIRVEAERLVATGLAAMSMAADRIGAPTRERGGAAAAGFDALGDVLFGPAGHRRHSVANDSTECCRCPVCRVISAARNPSPEFAERLATGVGQVAQGAARVLRGVAGVAGAAGAAGPDPASPRTEEADPWAAATAEPPTPAPAALVTAPAVPADPGPLADPAVPSDPGGPADPGALADPAVPADPGEGRPAGEDAGR